jgi:hypothetical protein
MKQLNTSELDKAIQDLGSSLSSIINRALTVEDMRMQSLTSVEFNAEEEKGVYGKGLHWKGDGPTKQFVYRANPDRIWTTESIDLNAEASYMIANTPVLRQGELGSSVRISSLVKVGTLQELKTAGDLTVDGYIFYNSDAETLGIGTDAPNGRLSVATLDSEFVVDNEPNAVKLGTWTTDDLKIVTDNTARLTIRANGNIDIGHAERAESKVSIHGRLGVGVNNVEEGVSLSTSGPIKFENKKFTVGSNPPTSGTFRQGDIVWNENPVPTGYVGWICVREGTPGEWKPFAQIAK